MTHNEVAKKLREGWPSLVELGSNTVDTRPDALIYSLSYLISRVSYNNMEVDMEIAETSDGRFNLSLNFILPEPK